MRDKKPSIIEFSPADCRFIAYCMQTVDPDDTDYCKEIAADHVQKKLCKAGIPILYDGVTKKWIGWNPAKNGWQIIGKDWVRATISGACAGISYEYGRILYNTFLRRVTVRGSLHEDALCAIIYYGYGTYAVGAQHNYRYCRETETGIRSSNNSYSVSQDLIVFSKIFPQYTVSKYYDKKIRLTTIFNS